MYCSPVAHPERSDNPWISAPHGTSAVQRTYLIPARPRSGQRAAEQPDRGDNVPAAGTSNIEKWGRKTEVASHGCEVQLDYRQSVHSRCDQLGGVRCVVLGCVRTDERIATRITATTRQIASVATGGGSCGDGAGPRPQSLCDSVSRDFGLRVVRVHILIEDCEELAGDVVALERGH